MTIVGNNSARFSVRYALRDYWNELGDPRIESYLFMNSFEPVLIILMLYGAFVLLIGPRLMANRRPFILRRPMILYNILMSLVNGFYCCLIFVEHRHFFPCIFNVDFPDRRQSLAVWQHKIIYFGHLYFLTKIGDLTDTIFFVLRKKWRQVSWLHVYHHSTIVAITWVFIRVNPLNYNGMLFCLLNSFVHTIMYAYYGLAAIGPHMQRYLWWKRYVTQLQIAQFWILFFHSLYFYTHQRGYPVFIMVIHIWQVGIHIVLFTNMYWQLYKKTEGAKHKPIEFGAQNAIKYD